MKAVSILQTFIEWSLSHNILCSTSLESRTDSIHIHVYKNGFENGFTIIAQPDVMAACDEGSLDQEYFTLLGDIAAGGPDGSGGLALETAGGLQRMQFSNGGAAP